MNVIKRGFANYVFDMNGKISHGENSSGLIRGLGLWAATAIVIGSMIGQAVFLVASDMSREVGSATKVLTQHANRMRLRLMRRRSESSLPRLRAT